MSRITGFSVSAAAAVILAGFAAAAWGQPQDPKGLGFKKQFVIEVRNPSPLTLENHPVVLSADKIRAFAPDFNTYNYAIFEETGGNYRLVLSQADDLDMDRFHDEIVFIRTLPPASTSRLACYYSPKGNFQLMVSKPKASARLGSGRGGGFLGWESNLAAFKFIDGRVEVLAKLYPGLVLMKPQADETVLQEWGMSVLPADGSLGLGGLSVWSGKTKIPRAASSRSGGPRIERTVVSAGPVRALVKAECTAAGKGQGGARVTVFYSVCADNAVSRQDVLIAAPAGAPVVFSAGLQKLAGEEVMFDKARGLLAAWGRGSEGAGDAGLGLLFEPSEFVGLDEAGPERSVKLQARPGKRQTFWTIGGWGRGIVTADPPAAKSWALKVAELGVKCRVPVEVEFKSK